MDTNFSGPVRTGNPLVGTSGLSTVGTVSVVRRIPVSADGPYAPISLPNCHIARLWANVETAWEGSAGETSTIRIGTSADATKYGLVVVSAVGTREITVSGAALLSLAEGTQLVVDVTTAVSSGAGTASVWVEYLQLS